MARLVVNDPWNRLDDVMKRFFWSPRDLSRHWEISVRTLERWRAESKGPAWLRLNGKVLYRIDDVMAFEEAHRHGSSLQAVGKQSASIPRRGTGGWTVSRVEPVGGASHSASREGTG